MASTESENTTQIFTLTMRTEDRIVPILILMFFDIEHKLPLNL